VILLQKCSNKIAGSVWLPSRIKEEKIMILSKEGIKELEMAARPLIKFLNNSDIFHPHVTAVVDCGRVELLEGIVRIPIDDYIVD